MVDWVLKFDYPSPNRSKKKRFRKGQIQYGKLLISEYAISTFSLLYVAVSSISFLLSLREKTKRRRFDVIPTEHYRRRFFVTSWPHKSISLLLKRPVLWYVKFSSWTQKQKEKQKEKPQFRLATDQYWRWKHSNWCELCSLSGCEMKQFHLHPIMRSTSLYELDQIWLWVSVQPASNTCNYVHLLLA